MGESIVSIIDNDNGVKIVEEVMFVNIGRLRPIVKFANLTYI